jgi:hypothetical protein
MNTSAGATGLGGRFIGGDNVPIGSADGEVTERYDLRQLLLCIG